MTLRIDAHQHFWRIAAHWHEWPGDDLPTIWCGFLAEHLAPALQDCRIEGTVLVQSRPSDADTDWMLALAKQTPSILDVVGWVDVTGPDAVERIGALAGHSRLKGLRPMLQNLPLRLDPSAFRRGGDRGHGGARPRIRRAHPIVAFESHRQACRLPSGAFDRYRSCREA